MKKDRVLMHFTKIVLFMGKELTYLKSSKYALILKTRFIKRLEIKLHESVNPATPLGVVPVDSFSFDYPVRKLPKDNSTDPYFVNMETFRLQVYKERKKEEKEEQTKEQTV